MWLLALRTLRFRKAGFIGTFVAMVLATALVMACASLMETGVRMTVPPQRLAAAEIVVIGDPSYRVPGTDESADLEERVRLPVDLVSKVEDVSGVAEAVGDTVFPVALPGGDDLEADVATFGHGWGSATLAPYALVNGRAPARPYEVALDAAVARRSNATIGDRVDLLIAGLPESVRVVGMVEPPAPTSQGAVFFSDAEAQLLSGHEGQVDSIGVLTDADTEFVALEREIDTALNGRAVLTLTGDERGQAEFPEVRTSGETLIVVSAVFGGMAILVAMLVVASMLGLSILLRQRELALLRAIGATPRQVRRMILAETAIVSVFAIILGAAVGALLGRWLFDRVADLGLVSHALVYQQGWIPIAAGAGTALFAALGVAAVSGKRAARTRPTEALAEADLQSRWLTPGRLILALLFIGGGFVLALVTATVMTGPVAASTAAPTVLLFAIGLGLLGPGVARVAIGVLRWPFGAVPGVANYLAVANARVRRMRMAAVIVPIMLATAVATAELYLQTTETSATERGYTEKLQADLVLTSSMGGFSRTDVDTVRGVPGVTEASVFASSTGYVEVPHDPSQGEDGWPLQGISTEGARETLSGIALRSGSLDDLRGDTVALSVDHARDLDRGPGDMIAMRFGDGALVDLRVVALFSARPGFDIILMPVETLAAHTTIGLPSQILVRTRPGADGDAVKTALTMFAARRLGVDVADRAKAAAALVESQQIQESVNALLIGVIVAYTGIAVINTLIIATGERRREFGMQRLIGSTRGQVIRMSAIETILVTVAGIVLGTVISATTLIPFSLAVSDTLAPSGPVWIYLAVVVTAFALTLPSTLIPAWLVTRSAAVAAAK
jgi:putative ABC transport system permease protein